MNRLPYAKFALWTLVLTAITSVIMVPIRWNGEVASEERIRGGIAAIKAAVERAKKG
mgnify:CR=1 FL=1